MGLIIGHLEYHHSDDVTDIIIEAAGRTMLANGRRHVTCVPWQLFQT